jgi:tRNA pseudouridine55 synthase
MNDGLLIVNKEPGMTSHQVIAALRRILRQSQIGHTGTLDPAATGVLVVGLGAATRIFQFLDETCKLYQAEVILGQATDTQDATGRVVTENPSFTVNQAEIARDVRRLTGVIAQTPPMYSAVKINGRKLYDLARQGVEVARPSRQITVFEWKTFHSQPNYGFRDRFLVEIFCSKGTYVRTLIYDLGALLGCGAHMGRLNRLRSGKFSLEAALTLAQIEEFVHHGQLDTRLISLNSALSHLPWLQLDESDLAKVANGGKLSYRKYPASLQSYEYIRLCDPAGRLAAVAVLQEEAGRRFWRPVKVFHLS